MSTMQETENSIIDDLKELGDVLSQTEFLIRLGKASEGIPESERADEDLIRDCQTKTWVNVRSENVLSMKYDSQSLIVKGALALFEEIFSGRTLDEINVFDCCLIKEPCFRKLFSDRQVKGLESIVKKLSHSFEKLSK